MDGRDGGLALARLCPGQRRPGLRMQEGAPERSGRGWQSPRSAARTCLPAPGASGCNWAPPRVHGGSTRCPRSRPYRGDGHTGRGRPRSPAGGGTGGDAGGPCGARNGERTTATPPGHYNNSGPGHQRCRRGQSSPETLRGPTRRRRAQGGGCGRRPQPRSQRTRDPEAPLQDAKWDPGVRECEWMWKCRETRLDAI